METEILTHQTENISEELKKSNGKLWYSIGILNENEDLHTEAIRCYEISLKHNPYNLDALLHLAHIYKLKKQYLEAVHCYDEYLKINPKDGHAWMNLGECFLALYELNKAHTCLKNANKFLRQDQKLWFQLGCLYEKAGLFDKAEMYYRKVLENGYPENVSEIQFKLAMICKHNARYNEAYEILTNECWSNPPEGMEQPDILCQLVQLFQLTNSIEIAKDAHMKAVSLLQQNENQFVVIVLAWLIHLIAMNPTVRQVMAIEDELPYQVALNVITKDPSYKLGLYVYGRILADSKHQQNAFDAFHQALQIDHNNPLYWCSIGNLYYNTEQYSEAIKAYFKAISLSPQLPEVWYNMGSLYIFHNQKEDANSSFKRAHELDPKNPTYKSMNVYEKTNEKLPIIDPSPFATLPHFTIDTFTKPSLNQELPLGTLQELQKIRVPDLTKP